MLFSSSGVILGPAEKGKRSPAGFFLSYCRLLRSQQAPPPLVPSLRATWVFPELVIAQNLFGSSHVSIVPIAVCLPPHNQCFPSQGGLGGQLAPAGPPSLQQGSTLT